MCAGQKASFFYFKWEDRHKAEKPYVMFVDVPKGFPPTNYVCDRGAEEEVCNLRGHEAEFSLDNNGFAIRKHNFGTIDHISDNSIKDTFLDPTEILMNELLGPAIRVVWFDWRIRTSDRSKTDLPAGTKVHLDDSTIPLAPIQSAHVDQSRPAAMNRIRRHMGDEAERLLNGRVRIINVWKPLRHPVNQYPLAVCDGSTVSSDRLVEIDVVRKSYVGGIYNLLPSREYKWYFLDQHGPDEVLFMKMFDSSTQARAACCPHAAFKQETVLGTGFRESIEARALVFGGS